MLEKLQKRIINFPLLLVASYLLLSIFLFIISPMFPFADNRALTIFYGLLAVGAFALGYMWASRREALVPIRLELGVSKLNIIIIIMCVVNIMYYIPQIQRSLSYYGYGITDVFSDIGENYLTKDDLIDQIGQETLGLFYTIVNLFSFFQIAALVIPVFKWKKINIISKLSYIATSLVTIYFYISIGTMSGVFFTFILSLGGWFAGRYVETLSSEELTYKAANKIKRAIAYASFAALSFFVFMVVSLASRSTRITASLPLLYDDSSFVYKILGHRLGDGLGFALAYVSHGWYGLGKSFDVDFYWTRGLSSSRVFTSYYYRFTGVVNGPIPLSYPVRQENITGFPPFEYWSTVFPWLASDFTFPGALILTFLFGAFYGKVWVGAIREGCLISATLFGLLSIGALFINANCQILDSKQLALALLALCMMYPFRRSINRWVLR